MVKKGICKKGPPVRCNAHYSKLFISAFSYSYGSVFKLKIADITVGSKTSSHVHVDEF